MKALCGKYHLFHQIRPQGVWESDQSELRKSGLAPGDKAALGQTHLHPGQSHLPPQDQPILGTTLPLRRALAVPFVLLGAGTRRHARALRRPGCCPIYVGTT